MGKIDEFEKLRIHMVEEQIVARGISNKNLIEVLKKIPRHIFVPPSKREYAYEDYPLDIGFGQTISQPYIVALMTEELELTPNDRVLEIGTGSGYQTAILASLSKEVYTIERIPQLLERAKRTLDEIGFKNINFFEGNGWYGLEEFAPFDKIIVTAAPEVIPLTLKKQLKPGGIMIIPVGPLYNQVLKKVIKKDDNKFDEEVLEAVRFVPLVREGDSRED